MVFGKRQTDLANVALIWQISPHMGKVQGRMMVKLFHNFLAKHCALATFCLAKFGEIKRQRQGFLRDSLATPSKVNKVLILHSTL